jgi:hypothetical protein
MSLHPSRPESRRSPRTRKGAKARHSSSPRVPQDPSHLEELETAAQTEVSEIPAEVDAGFTEPSDRTSGASDEEGDRLAVVEAGLSVDPEDLGRQFLKDATEQDNFESDLTVESEEGSVPIDVVTADAMLAAREAALGQSEKSTVLPAPDEAGFSEVDLHSSAIREGSLFDQPTEQGTRSPRVDADEDRDEGPRGARETAEAQALARLQRLTRPRRLRRAHPSARPRAHR